MSAPVIYRFVRPDGQSYVGPDAYVTLPTEMAESIDRWRGGQPGVPNFSEAIRRLIELGLASEAEKAGKRRAN